MRTTATAVIALALITVLTGQQAALPDARSLPPQLRGAGQQALNAAIGENARVDAVQELGDNDDDATLRFLVAVFASEPSTLVRRAIAGSIAQSRNPRAAGFLDLLRARSDPSSLTFIQSHVAKRQREMSDGLARAMTSAPEPSTPIPGITDHARFIVIGDFGTWEHGQSDIQEQVARALKRFRESEQWHAQFGITVGDNFYPLGIDGPDDARWGTDWESLYGPLGITFFASLGNHDHYGGQESIDAEIEHKSTSWSMPRRYYSVIAGDTELFAIDSQTILDQQSQMAWLETVLARSTARWKIVYGHHPFVSGGKHGINGELRGYREKLLPVLVRNRVDLYVTGHDHDLQLLKTDGVYQPVVGGSGKDGESVTAVNESLFCSAGNGFAYIETADANVRIRLIRAPDATAVYDCAVQRDPQSRALSDQCTVKCP